MDKTTTQGKVQELNSTSEEDAMCDKAADSSLDGMVDSSAASFNAERRSKVSIEDQMSFVSESHLKEHSFAMVMIFNARYTFFFSHTLCLE